MKSLTDSVQVLAGVGPKRAQALQELGIQTIEDLITYYPFRYEDLAAKKPQEVADQQKVTFQGIVATAPTIARFGRHKVRVNFRLLVENSSVMVTFFNQPWIKKQLEANQEVAIYGKWDANRQSLTGIKIITEEQGMEAVYPTNKHIRQATIQQLVEAALNEYAEQVQDVIPEALIEKYRLMHRLAMIKALHFPGDEQITKQARRTAMFEEFLVFQMGLQVVKSRDRVEKGTKIDYQIQLVREFIQQLPFELTGAQKRVTNEILANLKSAWHMNRLLQGDVGSGKTVVAAIAMYATITSGHQAALMAPTEILAEQHANNLIKFFANFDVKIGLLVGGMRKKVRNELLEAVKAGEIDIVIGTHALIQDDVEFKNLGLAIIDEQHRFGVNQRQKLRQKGANPDILAMTATPIPRTLAITAYGDMDVSIIDQLPAGRKPVVTKWLKKGEWDKVLALMEHEFKKGRQAFVVAPLIEESEVMDLQNAMALYEELKDFFGQRYAIGILHGKMDGAEKDQIMADFKAGKYAGLVSTTVIEVGVDVPNATLMVIQDADRFGLAQLHQLRGRIGRGQQQAYCLLVADPKNAVGKQRMQIMVETNNGFRIAEADLKMRGQGDLFGQQQSGVPEFKVGDPVLDLGALQTAQLEAAKIVNQPDWQSQPAFQNLAKYLNQVMQIEQGLD
ncbi:ATP-dependent DNA helicase RecG [Pediococcus acidilactici]|uniref:ATP-dependent DNA helicase RecG n=1 Tax=Pediococcus acidilactici TaxID=1254 RepID=UPI000326EDEB|nr:ATP-dependent DNA helicase RecG [Pediococcus acidilactici]EOA09208.1 ATP-dependent DNA helicase RecG, recG [Pediococcus acidilactici D3]MBW4796695.1 ATP-dependent DNA helicase RecG [Pediococcus acidilactici]MBW9305947.1 ATP-dependent DNA helicase RecG [Pediococcus acidilactici]MCE5961630.1 ATP-dependent DNA helicase RecG [Pediococcus acidilactici]MCW8082567.1 ATP-dependent DNA helicase RecG [Pediococcus acidilactici]